MTQRSAWQPTEAGLTVGLDVGDQASALCVLDADGEVVAREAVRTRSADLQRRFAALTPARVVLEVGMHSPWVSRLLASLGHQVVVANPRRVRLIAEAQRKDDRRDAELLARLGRVDPQLLAPVYHRGEQAQTDLTLLRARDGLVRSRSLLINQVRGLVKSSGARLPRCDADGFHRHAAAHLPAPLVPALQPLLAVIEQLTAEIQGMDRAVRARCERYPETAVLRQVHGVGPITALAFVLTLEHPERFEHSRDVGAYLGLTPRRRQSGDYAPQLRITKAGDRFLRRLLVGSARYILGPFGQDCELQRWGLARAPKGAPRAQRNRIAIAVARRLAVLLHRLWTTGEVYEPLRRAVATAA
jgi:transposase